MLFKTSVAALLAVSLSACGVDSPPKTDLAARLSQLDQTPPGLCSGIRERIDALSAKSDEGRISLSEKDIEVAKQLVRKFPEPDPSALDMWVEFNQLPSSEKSAALLSALPAGACLIEFDRVSAALLDSLGELDDTGEQRDQVFSLLRGKAQRIYDGNPTMLAVMLKVRLYENLSKAKGVDLHAGLTLLLHAANDPS